MTIAIDSNALVHHNAAEKSAEHKSAAATRAVEAAVTRLSARDRVLRVRAAMDLFDLATHGLAAAAQQPRAELRFTASHLAALRAAAAVVAAQSPSSGQRRISSVWRLLAREAPELAEWAAFFELGTSKRAAVANGSVTVTTREADDLLRDAVTFAERVGYSLGLQVLDLASVGERLAVT